MGELPRIGITAGDPGGVGPEVVEKALRVVGDGREMGVEFVRIGVMEGRDSGRATLEGARLALSALEEAMEGLQSGELKGVVTGPVCKRTMREVGFKYAGQTEFFAERSGVGVNKVSMLFGARVWGVGLVTIHEALRRVASLVSEERVEVAGRHLAEFLVWRIGRKPRVAVAGLNPHAGEGGEFGDEEMRLIVPAIEKLRGEGVAEWEGPLAGDSIFPLMLGGKFDGMLAMYHDQGLGPLKAVFFHEAVNVTWGLPFVRCSPDHGTGFEIAGKGEASAGSMEAALRIAAELVVKRVEKMSMVSRI
ncbi:MAG: 4-hydroxythreonine-4-phosphate dehydrogenase PdxA [Chthoniobacterales bacterium]|nr:4-hydroxythreonine-4-phosphate dehydrogenase PdxA [Chthoniobacterales bacterium]